jgi:hypothetical protein
MPTVYGELMVIIVFDWREVGTATVEFLCIDTDLIDLLYTRKIKKTPIENRMQQQLEISTIKGLTTLEEK